MTFDKLLDKYKFNISHTEYVKSDKTLVIVLDSYVEDDIKNKFINELKEVTSFISNVIFKETIKAKEEKLILNARNNIYKTYSDNKPAKKSVTKKTNSRFNKIGSIRGEFYTVLKAKGFVGIDSQIQFKATLSNYETRDTKNNSVEYKMYFYDGTASIIGKFYIKKADTFAIDNMKKYLKIDNIYAVKGKCLFDYWLKQDCINVDKIMDMGKKEVRTDESGIKRIELHCSTNKGFADATVPVKEYVQRAMYWNYDTLAIVDKDSVHSFVDAYDYIDENNLDFKIIYGLEGSLYDNNLLPFDNSIEEDLDASYIVFDVETTGLNVLNDEIIEIGAVKVNGRAIVDTYKTFVKIDKSIPENITEITGISDKHLEKAPYFNEIVDDFLEFIDGSILVAHNATFDVAFIKNHLAKCGIEKELKFVDTIALSKVLIKNIKRYGLKRVASYFKVSLDNHHRALDDAMATAKIFINLLQHIQLKGFNKIKELNTIVDLNEYNIKSMGKSLFNVLVKNQNGMTDLYEMFSNASIYGLDGSKINYSKDLINKFRKNLLIGSSALNGEIFRAYLDGKDVNELYKFYDYVEICPFDIAKEVYSRGELYSAGNYYNIIKRIVEDSPIPVVATSFSKYLEKEDYIYRNIIKFNDKNNRYHEEKLGAYYFRNTKEMFDDFKFINEYANKVIVDNPNIINDMIEKSIEPYKKGKFPPFLENSDSILRNTTYKKAHSMYGKKMPEEIEKRLEYELGSIINNGFAVLYIAAQKLVNKSNEMGYIVGSRGSVGSSLVATMMGITDVNPLRAHYYCSDCEYVEFIDDARYEICYDLPLKKCPKCKNEMVREGFNIPFESFMGFKGDKEPDIDLNFSSDIQSFIQKYTEEFFGEEFVFKAGTVGAIKDKIAYGYIKSFYEKLDIDVSDAEIMRISPKLIGISKSTGQHAGGVIVVPKDKSIYEFTPIQYPSNDKSKGVYTTHFDYHAIKGTLLKLDILGHETPYIIKRLEDYTENKDIEVVYDDKQLLELFRSTKSLNIKYEGYDQKLGTFGIPEFGTPFVRGMLETTNPKSVMDLIRISGLSHGTDVWKNNAEDLVLNNVIEFKDVIATREQVMINCINKGIDRDISFGIMEKVKKGKPLTEDEIKVMKEHKIEDWYIESCNKIGYMFPIAHAVAYVLTALRIAYYKVYEPLAFYAAHLSTKSNIINASCLGGIKELEELLSKELEDKSSKKDEKTIAALEVVKEMMYRGYEFLPVDLYKSDSDDFKIENGKLRPPLICVDSLGDKAARSIVEARKDYEFISVEDLKKRTNVNNTSINSLSELGCLDGLTELNQISLFEMDF